MLKQSATMIVVPNFNFQPLNVLDALGITQKKFDQKGTIYDTIIARQGGLPDQRPKSFIMTSFALLADGAEVRCKLRSFLILFPQLATGLGVLLLF